MVYVGNPPLCNGVIAVPSGPKSHTFTVILTVFAPSQDGVINREKVYYCQTQKPYQTKDLEFTPACLLRMYNLNNFSM